MTSANVGARLTVGTRYIVCDGFETLQTFDVTKHLVYIAMYQEIS